MHRRTLISAGAVITLLGVAGGAWVGPMGPVRPSAHPDARRVFHVVLVDRESEVSLVDEGGDVERLAGAFAGELRAGELAEFVVDERPELLGRLRVALPDGTENTGDVVHRWPKCGTRSPECAVSAAPDP